MIIEQKYMGPTQENSRKRSLVPRDINPKSPKAKTRKSRDQKAFILGWLASLPSPSWAFLVLARGGVKKVDEAWRATIGRLRACMCNEAPATAIGYSWPIFGLLDEGQHIAGRPIAPSKANDIA